MTSCRDRLGSSPTSSNIHHTHVPSRHVNLRLATLLLYRLQQSPSSIAFCPRICQYSSSDLLRLPVACRGPPSLRTSQGLSSRSCTVASASSSRSGGCVSVGWYSGRHGRRGEESVAFVLAGCCRVRAAPCATRTKPGWVGHPCDILLSCRKGSFIVSKTAD